MRKLLKLVSEYGRWSFCNGCQYYDNVVYLVSKNDVSLYELVDEEGKTIYKPTLKDVIEEKK